MYLINSTAARLAKECTAEHMARNPGSRKFVAGAVGPTNKTLSVSPSVENPAFRGITYEEVEEAYYQQLQGLYDGGVDLFLVVSFHFPNEETDGCVHIRKVKGRAA